MQPYGRGVIYEKSKRGNLRWSRSLAAKAQPDQIDGPANSHEQADQGENPLIQPLVQPIADAAPEDQAR